MGRAGRSGRVGPRSGHRRSGARKRPNDTCRGARLQGFANGPRHGVVRAPEEPDGSGAYGHSSRSVSRQARSFQREARTNRRWACRTGVASRSGSPSSGNQGRDPADARDRKRTELSEPRSRSSSHPLVLKRRNGADPRSGDELMGGGSPVQPCRVRGSVPLRRVEPGGEWRIAAVAGRSEVQ
jgi:hypothetical protein